LNIVIPEGASDSDGKNHEVIKEECVEKPDENPNSSEEVLS